MTAHRTAGGGGATPPPRSWIERIEDPDEPLFTVAVATDLLGTDPQTLRRLESAISMCGDRSSGNQRRYSRRDLETLYSACSLNAQGFSPAVTAKILQAQIQVSGIRI